MLPVYYSVVTSSMVLGVSVLLVSMTVISSSIMAVIL